MAGSVADRAAGYGIPGARVDGNDVSAVRSAMQSAIGRARAGGGPSLIEARTWRWRGHWAGDDQSYRSAFTEPADVEDPLDLFAHRLLECGTATLADLLQVHAQVHVEIEAAMQQAAAAPDAGEAELGFEDVFA
jgi:acetoin:2,6-dichlorophenolindophenol oxidoreductase subunit alpha